MEFLLYLGIFGCHAVGVFSQQKYSYSMKGVSDVCVYAFFTGVVALIIFYVSPGFNLQFNLPTLYYAIAYALVVILSYATSLYVFKFISISKSGFYSTGLTLIITSLFGYILFNEVITIPSILRIIIMFVALLALFISSNKNENKTNNNNKLKTLIGISLCVIAGFLGVGNTIISKAFAIDNSVTDSNALFFLTNLIIVIVAIIVFLIVKRGNLKKCALAFKEIKVSNYLVLVALTISSNITSLLGVYILATGSVSLFAPITNALRLLAYQLVGYFVQKEKLQIAPCILSLIAIVLGIWG